MKIIDARRLNRTKVGRLQTDRARLRQLAPGPDWHVLNGGVANDLQRARRKAKVSVRAADDHAHTTTICLALLSCA